MVPGLSLARLLAPASFAAALLVAGLAQATPFSFEFDMPLWGVHTNNAAEFGTGAVLDLTVDNGGASALSQSYTLAQITSLSATAIGGTFAASWSASDLAGSANTSTNFLATDATGAPTLDLLAQANPAFIQFESGGLLAVLQILKTNGVGGPSFELADLSDFPPNFFAGQAIGPINCGASEHDNCGFAVAGTALGGAGPVAVPEPSSLAALAIGLIALLLLSRKGRSAAEARS